MQPEKENLTTNTKEHDDYLTPTDPPTTTEQDMNVENPDDNTETDIPLDDAEMGTKPKTFDFLRTGTKRQLPTDSDSDNAKPFFLNLFIHLSTILTILTLRTAIISKYNVYNGSMNKVTVHNTKLYYNTIHNYNTLYLHIHYLQCCILMLR